MNYTIENPKTDHDDNPKENIFIAYDDIGNPIGNAYTYPVVNHYQTYKNPYMIYFEIMVGVQVEDICGLALKEALYDKVYKRALELRKEKSHLEAKFYTGFMNDPEKLDCFIKKGFKEDCTIIMNLKALSERYVLKGELEYRTVEIDDEEEFLSYQAIHNQLFINPLDVELLNDMQHSEHFKCVIAFKGDNCIGGCTLFLDEGLGYIENLFVTPNYIGKGYSKEILTYALNYFSELNAREVDLEVWKSNERAVKLYEQFGFSEIAVNIMFPSLII